MNKISFIIEFYEVSKTHEEQLTEFIEKTGIKFQVLESDNDLKKYKKYKEVIDKAIEYIEWFRKDNMEFYKNKCVALTISECDGLLDILKEVE